MKFYYSTTCDIFDGFYESVYYNGDTLYNFEREYTPKGYEWDFFQNGFEIYTNEMSKKWVRAVRENTPSNIIEIKKFTSLWSPKYYNYTTDSIFFECKIHLPALKIYCFKTHKNDFTDFLTERINSIPLCYFKTSVFEDFTKNYKENKERNELINFMVTFYLKNETNWNSVLYQTMESQWEILTPNIALLKQDDNTKWDFEFNNDIYTPTKKIG